MYVICLSGVFVASLGSLVPVTLKLVIRIKMKSWRNKSRTLDVFLFRNVHISNTPFWCREKSAVPFALAWLTFLNLCRPSALARRRFAFFYSINVMEGYKVTLVFVPYIINE